MPYYDHPRAALTADVVMLHDGDNGLRVLLIRRSNHPFQGMWALPGGFVDQGERVEAAARRELAEETGLVWDGPLVQVGAFADPGRDPRGWTASVVWVGVTDDLADVRGGDDAADAAWVPVESAQGLAFDHDEVIVSALETVRLRGLLGR